MTVALRRGVDHHWSGPRLPTTSKRAHAECWRCTEVAEKRVLRRYALTIAGVTVASVLLCGPCAASGTPLDPDPLDATGVG